MYTDISNILAQTKHMENPYSGRDLSNQAQFTPSRVGLATLGGFTPPENITTANPWKLVRTGGVKVPNSFPPPINDIQWQGFFTREVTGYPRKLYWVCGYGILPAETSGTPMMIMCQWWHTEPVSISNHKLLSSEDWDNANIYITPLSRLEDMFISSQLEPYSTPVNANPNPTQWEDVIDVSTIPESPVEVSKQPIEITTEEIKG